VASSNQADIYDDLLTVPEVAEWLRVEPRFVYRLVSSGDLIRCGVGRYIRIPAESVRDYLKANTSVAVKPTTRPRRPGGRARRHLRAVRHAEQ
jgi:excisionase family DNA binding protein